MPLRCGIVGLPNVGKSTFFNAVTGTQAAVAANYPFCTIEPNVGISYFHDDRLDELAMIAKSKCVLYSSIEFVDIAGLVKGASEGNGLGNQFLSHIRSGTDAILYMVRCFDNDDILHVNNKIDPLYDIDIIKTELILADLQSIDIRIPNLEKKARIDPESKKHLEMLVEIRKELIDGHLASRRFNEAIQPSIKQLHMITTKPTLYVCNVDEDSCTTGNAYSMEVQKSLNNNLDCITVSAQIEYEISLLENPLDRKDFLKSIGLQESGLNRVTRAVYRSLNLSSYFTVGEKEARSWPFKNGITAQEAAGIIHSDFERGFICAEVISFEDFIKYGGEAGAREMGKMRLEGKKYIVVDGDVMHFRFNV